MFEQYDLMIYGQKLSSTSGEPEFVAQESSSEAGVLNTAEQG
jgi:hypothetical protein